VLRGGKMNFEDISKPKQTSWGKAQNAFGASLDITKQLNQCAQEVAKKAIQQGDAHLCHFIDTHLLSELTVSLKFIAEGVNKIKDGDFQSISHYDQGLRRCVERLYAGQTQQLTGIYRPDDQVTCNRTTTSNIFTPVPYGRSSRSGYSQLMENLLQ
jgi:Ferritin-like domain